MSSFDFFLPQKEQKKEVLEVFLSNNQTCHVIKSAQFNFFDDKTWIINNPDK